MRLGWFRPVHCKSIGAQETRAMLTARKLVQSKLQDIENHLRGILRGFGLKVGKTTNWSFAERIRKLVAQPCEPGDDRRGAAFGTRNSTARVQGL
jgi:transposase